MKKIISVLALTILPSLAFANVNLVTNGSFEADTVASGTWGTFSPPTGWTGVAELRNNVAGAASDGVNYAELDANFNGSISQIINTTSVGFKYNLTFDYSPRENVSAASNPIEVWWNDTLLTSPPITGTGGPSGNVWKPYTFSVIGTGHDNLTFTAVGISDSVGGSLDNINVTAVPEPEAYAMFLAGLGLIGFMARRRKED